jgi:hypothetical protein
MSTPVGFRYLFDSGYINREMDIWFHVRVFPYDKLSALILLSRKERNIHYVIEIEVWLAKTMEFIPVDDEDDVQ